MSDPNMQQYEVELFDTIDDRRDMLLHNIAAAINGLASEVSMLRGVVGKMADRLAWEVKASRPIDL